MSFNYEKIKDPTFFKENVLPAYAAVDLFESSDAYRRGESGLRMSLDGIWKFSYAKNPELACKDFEKESFDCSVWDDIRVPAHIQLEGYDTPQYVNVQYPWDGREKLSPGMVPTRFNPTASYVKYFELPQAHEKDRTHIVFHGVESGMAVWLNGSYVGYSEDSFTPSAFDITPFLKKGKNKLAVQVYKWTSSSWCEDQDFYRFSGIFRSVELLFIPSVHVKDITVQTLFTENDFTKATLLTKLCFYGKGSYRLTLKDKGETLFTEEGRCGESVTISREILSPKLWSAENPYLYELELTLFDERQEEREYGILPVGFRQFAMKCGRMLLNGKRIVFKGVNRHEFSFLTGRSVSKEEMIQDILTMKRNNINAIRTSHYPNSELLYTLCDRYGLYMIAENNLESHGSWDAYLKHIEEKSYVVPGDKKEWQAMMLDRVTSAYERDKNHPSILIWSIGNESYGGSVPYEMAEHFRKLDSTRLVHYEGIFHDRSYPDTSDMESRMYAKAAEIEAYLKTNPKKPFISCEYAHSMGNSTGAMHKYTQLADAKDSGYQGGFIWDYIDQSLYKKDRYGNVFQAYGGDFLERPTDYNFCGDGIAYAKGREASPKMQEVKFLYQNIAITVGEKSFTVWNKHLFLNTAHFDCKAILLRDGKVVEEKALTQIDVLPEETREFPLPFDQKDYEGMPGEYVATVSFVLKEDTLWATRGHEVAFGQGILWKNVAAPKEKQAIEIIRGDYNIGVRGQNFEALFATENGGLVSYRYAGKELIMAIPKPNFWRAPTDNDAGNNMAGRLSQWKIASMYLTHRGIGKKVQCENGYVRFENPILREEKNYVSITYLYNLQTTPKAECSVEYCVFGDGSIQTTLSYDPVAGLPGMPEFGMLFKFDADLDTVTWYGNGPQETYADRKMGAKLGLYTNHVADNMAEYLVPQECGNKTDVRFAKVTDVKGRGLCFSSEGGMNFSALPYTPHEIENASHPYELPQVHYTVVRVAESQMGVGGDDSWGAPVHPEYLLPYDKKMKFTFTFKGI